MSAQPLRIGILGAARIAPPALIEPARTNPDVVVTAVAARDRSRAEAYAAEHGIPIVTDDYQALIEHPEVDAVYVALPPSRHADLTLAALAAGKPVLCEKPFAMNADEVRAMVSAADAAGLILMEAFHYRYHPLFARVLETVASGEVGTVRRLEATFQTAIAATAGELRYDPALGGGALMDLGTYCVHWCRTVAGSEPTVIAAQATLADTGVDMSTHADLAFDNGITAKIVTDMIGPPRATLMIEGDGGSVKVINPLAPQLGHLLEVNGRKETVTRESTYAFQLAAFVEAVRTGKAPLTSGADTVGQMATLDAIKAASRA